MRLSIDAIVVDPTVQIRAANDPDTVQRYAEALDALPPVDVFLVDGAYLLVDGFHRVEAAVLEGRTEIEAVVHRGSRQDAIEFAALANLAHGKPLDREERNAAIRRLAGLPGDAWSHQRLAQRFGVSRPVISKLFAADRVRAEVVEPTRLNDFATSSEADDRLTDSHYAEISRAPRETWQPLVDAAVEEDWDSVETSAAVAIVKDPTVPEADKQALLNGDADLSEFGTDRRRMPPDPTALPVPPPPTFGDVKHDIVREVEATGAEGRMLRNLLYSIESAGRWPLPDLVRGLDATERRQILDDLPGRIAWLTSLRDAIDRDLKPLEMV